MAKENGKDQTAYYHEVVDCQYACPAHTNVPEYIRLIFEQRYSEAYLLNQKSNMFPGILGRVCDRPCEPACRRGRFEGEEPVAICRLKRVAADKKGPIESAFPKQRATSGKKVAAVGGGPASLTLAHDLLRLGHEVTIFDKEPRLGGMMRYGVPAFRLPEAVLAEETERVVRMGATFKGGTAITNLSDELLGDFDAVFIGTGAPKGRGLELPGYEAAKDRVHVGLSFLKNAAFGHLKSLTGHTVVIGGGNTAMDCARTALRLGASSVTVCAPEAEADMLASPWEIADAEHEGIKFVNSILPVAYLDSGLRFDRLLSVYDDSGRFNPVRDGDKSLELPAEQIILAIGQTTQLGFIDAAAGVELNDRGLPVLDGKSLQSTNPKVFFGGDAAFGPTNIIWSVEHGHIAAESIHLLLSAKQPGAERVKDSHSLINQKMGVHQWVFDNEITYAPRQKVGEVPLAERLKKLATEVEVGFADQEAMKEARRCLNCDVQTVFKAESCIECDACLDICPTECLTIAPAPAGVQTAGASAAGAGTSLVMTSAPLEGTGFAMIKDENYCVHCGLCAEKCPTAAWGMEKFTLSRFVDTIAAEPTEQATEQATELAPLPTPAPAKKTATR